MGSAFTMSRHLKIPQKVAQEFQDRYCRGNEAAFPCIPLYWQWCIEQVQTNYKIVTPFGRERHFFGDTHADTTAREAIAFIPQSATSDRTNLGFWRTWKHVPEAKLLAQTYDSVTFQLPENSSMHERVRDVVECLRTVLTDPKSGRSFEVPVDVKAGYNWGYFDKEKNPKGLKKFEFK
jgi:DNA polymerase I-like protein with 3'-5' exonuclease and polymerase domains